MFNVCRLKNADQPENKKEIVATVETQEAAIHIIEEELKRFKHSGRNEEHHYWWGRNENALYFIEGA